MFSNFHEDYDESNESASMLTTNTQTISKRLVYVEENNEQKTKQKRNIVN